MRGFLVIITIMKNRIYRGEPPKDQQKGPAIVLVHTQMGENIGMAARAMLNCGLTDLRLVAPRDGWPSDIAQRASSGALAVIEQARVFDTLAEAVADCTFVVGTTSRTRDMVKPILTPETTAQAVLTADKTHGKPTSALVFGAERTGLENDDLTVCDALLSIPLNPEYMSLNIAQAVLLTSYTWYQHMLRDTGKDVADQLAVSDSDVATKQETEYLLQHLGDALDESGFFTAPDLRMTVLRNLRNTFQRMRLSRQETHTFHGIVKSLRGGKEWKRSS